MPSDTGAIVLPSLSHIGVVVKDIDKTAEFLSSLWGFGPWHILDHSSTKSEMMTGEPFRIKEAHARLGVTEVELIQPLEKNSIWSQFIETNGEGLHHISFIVPNWEERVSRIQERGGRMVVGATFEGKRWAYFATSPGGMIIELEEQ